MEEVIETNEVNLIQCGNQYIPASNNDSLILKSLINKNCLNFDEMMKIQANRPVNIISLNTMGFIDPT